MGACMLTENTPEHRALLGENGVATIYFSGIAELVDRAKWLLAQPEERRRLAQTANAQITGGSNTYADRLRIMLKTHPLSSKLENLDSLASSQLRP